MKDIFTGIMIPFWGTSLGAACVFFMKGGLNRRIQCALMGFAAGVMVAASIWSLLLPALDQGAQLGRLSFLPAAVGFWIGMLFLLFIDHIMPYADSISENADMGFKKNGDACPGGHAA